MNSSTIDSPNGTVSLSSLQVSDLTPDSKNANKGTARGLEMLRASLEKLGAGRSIVLDRDGRIVAGNKTAQAAALAGLDDVIVVRTDGRKIVAVQRTDLDLDSPEGRELALADNRTQEVGLSWSADVLAQLQGDGLDLSGLFSGAEIDTLLGELSKSRFVGLGDGPFSEAASSNNFEAMPGNAGGDWIGGPGVVTAPPAGSGEGPTQAPAPREAAAGVSAPQTPVAQPQARPLGPQGAPAALAAEPIQSAAPPVGFKEFDESVAGGARIHRCPACGNRWAE